MFKLKLGAGEDVAQVRAVRTALGPGSTKIRVDANAAWSAADGITCHPAELEPFEIELAEQPVAGHGGIGRAVRD